MVSVGGRGMSECAADVTLSSLGWVAVTAHRSQTAILRVFTPAAKVLVHVIPSVI